MFWNRNLWDHFGIFHWNKINFFSLRFVQTESHLPGLQGEDRAQFPSSSFSFCGGRWSVEFRTGVCWANPVLRYFSQEEGVYHRKAAFFSPCFPLSPAGVEWFKLMWMWSLGTGGRLLQPPGILEDTSPKRCGSSPGAIAEFKGSGQFQTKKLNKKRSTQVF